ncbi:MAG: PAS domain S-box protein, partial [Alphaproteobacteria bacterium]|nr:PAS domain S-box protein [Alphaproteobacteria bacterium]
MADTTSDRSGMAPHHEEWPPGLCESVAAQSAILFYIADLGNGARTHFVSPNIERITGDPPADVLELPRYWRRHIHPDDLARYAECVARLSSGGASGTVQYRFRAADGTYRWFRDEIRREPGDAWHKEGTGRGDKPGNGKSGGTTDVIVGCVVDVTAETERLADYHDITSIHTTIVDAAPFAIVVVDAANRIVEFNAAAERMFLYRQDQVLGRSVSEAIVPEKHRAQHEAGIRRWREYVDHQRGPARVEAEAQRADGTLFPVSIVVAPTVWREGTVFVAVITDLTERVKAETERRQADQLLRDAVAALSEGFALFDADNKLVMCNDRYREFHGESADMLVPGLDWIDLMRTEAERGLYEAAVGRVEEWVEDRVQARRAPRANLEYERSDGRWLIGSNQKTRDGGFVVTLNEITERKEREREVQRAHEVL